MDWCLDTRVQGAADLVEAAIFAHLARHAIEPDLADLSRPAVREALATRDRGVWWLTADWTAQRCSLRLRPLPGEELLGDTLGPGATCAHAHARRLARGTAAAGRPRETIVDLAVPRRPERDIDPPATRPGSYLLERPEHLVGMISAGLDGGRSLEEAAALAGAALADQLDPPAPAGPGGMAAVARSFVELQRGLGADFEVIEADEDRAVIQNRRCPFGPATAPGMCRFTSALAGRMAARQGGAADVTLLESLAAGDPECRVVIDRTAALDPRISHRYDWPPPAAEDDPPAGGGDDPGATGSAGPAFQVSLSLQLPRDRLSVPITRHLIRAALDEIGVVADDADAVELAVTEACANVIDHSGPGDAYDVVVSMSPSSCHIRVVDVGRGFDHQALALSGMADRDAEHGRGVALMHALVDQVRFESEPEKGTVVHLVKHLTFEESAVAHKLMGKRD